MVVRKKSVNPAEAKKIITQFKKLHIAIISDTVKAAKLYVKILNEHPDFVSELKAAYPEFTPTIWKRLEDVGRDHLIPDLMFATFPAIAQIRKIPTSEQQKFHTNGVDVVKRTVYGKKLKTEVVHKPVKELSSEEASVAFNDRGNRNIDDQVAFLEKKDVGLKTAIQERIDAMKNRPWSYNVKENTVHIETPAGGWNFTKKEVIAMLKAFK